MSQSKAVVLFCRCLTYLAVCAAVFLSSLNSNLHAQGFLKQLEDQLLKNLPSTSTTDTTTQSNNTKPSNDAASPDDTVVEILPRPADKRKEPNRPANPFTQDLDLPSAIVDSNNPPPKPTPDNQTLPGNGANGGYLGLTAERTPGGGLGLAVVEITEGSPAWKAGFQIGDRIVAVAGHAVLDLNSFAARLAEQPINEPIDFLVVRGVRTRKLSPVLMDRNLAARINPTVPSTAVPPPAYPAANNFVGLIVADLADNYRRQYGIATFKGTLVTDVVPGSPAQVAGIRAGDCIIEVDRKVIQSAQDLQRAISQTLPGQAILLSFYRGRQAITATVRVSSDPQTSNYGTVVNGAAPYQSYAPTAAEYMQLQQELLRTQQQLTESLSRIRELEERLRSLGAIQDVR